MKILLKLLLISSLIFLSCEEANQGLAPIRDFTNSVSYSARAKINSGNSSNVPTLAKIGLFNTEKKFIKDGRIYYQVDNLETSLLKTKNILSNYGGFVQSEIENIRQNQKIIDLSLKVPNRYFESFIDSLTLIIGNYESRSVNLRDVTDRYIDTKVRIENKKRVEQKYLELLKKGTKIADLLAIEENLGKIREEIESAEKRLLKLSRDIEFSTVNVKLYKYSPEFKNLYSENYSLSASLKRGWHGMIRTIYSIITLWPLLLIIIILFFLIRKYLRKRKMKI